ncbi:hypothetical protein [Streptomyces sp. NPDC046727]|uniref:hypothetical protein n=1 Tax=Streptomyces sp. NPDC046727 TaxID=3155373 RepID=UPI0033EC2CD0
MTLAWHAVLLLFAKVLLPPLAPSCFPALGAAVVNLVWATAVGSVLWLLRRYGPRSTPAPPAPAT